MLGVREQYGERETVSRRVGYVLRSYLDWGVTKETDQKGLYISGPILGVDDTRLIAWLVEASLHAQINASAPLNDLLSSPSLFPFRLSSMSSKRLPEITSNLDILRHGLNEELVILRRSAKGLQAER